MQRHIRVPLTLVSAFVFCLGMPRPAAAQRCAHEAQRTATAPIDGIERVRIIAHAGDLEVTGHAGTDRIAARGRACSSDAGDLAELAIRVRRDGSTLVLEATDPERNARFGSHYAYIDLVVDLPQGMPVSIDDGSGNASVTSVGAARISDGSGNLRIRDVRGTLEIEDGSGNIELSGVAGSVAIEDGSGNVEIDDVRGDVEIDDGSGEIRVAGVTRNVRVNDGSGSIRAERVGGDFTVDEGGSGDVTYDGVDGRVSIGDDD